MVCSYKAFQQFHEKNVSVTAYQDTKDIELIVTTLNCAQTDKKVRYKIKQTVFSSFN